MLYRYHSEQSWDIIQFINPTYIRVWEPSMGSLVFQRYRKSRGSPAKVYLNHLLLEGSRLTYVTCINIWTGRKNVKIRHKGVMVWWWMIDNGSGVVFTSKRSSRLSTHTPEKPARRIPSLTHPAKTNYICVGELYLGFAIWTSWIFADNFWFVLCHNMLC